MHLRSERDFSWKSSREQERGPVWEGSGGESYSICNATAGQKVFLVPTQAKCLRVRFHQATQFNSSSFMNNHDVRYMYSYVRGPTKSFYSIQLNSILRHSHSLMRLVPFLIL